MRPSLCEFYIPPLGIQCASINQDLSMPFSFILGYHLAHGALVTVICALADSDLPDSPVGGWAANDPVLGPGGAILVYGMPALPVVEGICVA